MKTNPLNLLILDDNTLIIGPLVKYLQKKFGARVNIFPFYDTDTCLRSIDENSHVIVLDYFPDKKGKKSNNGVKIFNIIKNEKPKNQITLITSDKDIAGATEEMLKEISEYIAKRDIAVNGIFQALDKVNVTPVEKVLLPN